MFNIRHRHTTYYIHKRLNSGHDQGLKNLLVRGPGSAICEFGPNIF